MGSRWHAESYDMRQERHVEIELAGSIRASGPDVSVRIEFQRNRIILWLPSIGAAWQAIKTGSCWISPELISTIDKLGLEIHIGCNHRTVNLNSMLGRLVRILIRRRLKTDSFKST